MCQQTLFYAWLVSPYLTSKTVQWDKYNAHLHFMDEENTRAQKLEKWMQHRRERGICVLEGNKIKKLEEKKYFLDA